MTRRFPALCPLAAALAFAVSAAAQCCVATGSSIVPFLTATGPTFAIDDESRSSDLLLPFSFPIGGSTYDYVVVSSNGELYLTHGTGVVSPATFGVSGMNTLRGGVGGSPRIAAFGGDLLGVPGLVGWDIRFDDSVAGEVKVTYEHMRLFAGTGQDFTMSVTLYNSGAVKFDYSNGNFGSPGTSHWAFVSTGNNVGSGSDPEIDWNFPGDSGPLGLAYQRTFTPFDLDDQGILVTPNGNGGYAWSVPCGTPPNPPATHTSYGVGCYDTSVYRAAYCYLPDVVASAALAGQSYTFVPGIDHYTLMAGGNSFVALTAATTLNLGDDDESDLTPSTPFQYLGTTAIPTLSVCSNGWINMGPSGSNSVYAYASVSALLTQLLPSFRSNADYDPSAVGSGPVTTAEIGGVLYVTWDGVYRYGTTAAETLQFQLELSTGIVTVAYTTMASGGNGMLLGYAPSGPNADGGSLDLTSDLPHETAPTDVLSPAMSMSASPNPVSTAGAGTSISYTVNHSPELLPGSGLVAGVVILSLTGDPGLDLGPVGLPGCSLYVGGLDLTLSFAGAVGPQSVHFDVPPGVAPTTRLYAEAAALAPVNSFGAATSNGIESLISDH